MRGSRSKIGWWEPYWFHVPLLLKDGYLTSLLRPASKLRRLVLVVIFLTLALAFCAIQLYYWHARLPLPLPVTALPFVAALIATEMVVQSLIPRRVVVGQTRITAVGGSRSCKIRADQINDILLDWTVPTRPILVVSYRSHLGESCEFTSALSSKVDPTRLAQCLPPGFELRLLDNTDSISD